MKFSLTGAPAAAAKIGSVERLRTGSRPIHGCESGGCSSPVKQGRYGATRSACRAIRISVACRLQRSTRPWSSADLGEKAGDGAPRPQSDETGSRSKGWARAKPPRRGGEHLGHRMSKSHAFLDSLHSGNRISPSAPESLVRIAARTLESTLPCPGWLPPRAWAGKEHRLPLCARNRHPEADARDPRTNCSSPVQGSPPNDQRNEPADTT